MQTLKYIKAMWCMLIAKHQKFKESQKIWERKAHTTQEGFLIDRVKYMKRGGGRRGLVERIDALINWVLSRVVPSTLFNKREVLVFPTVLFFGETNSSSVMVLASCYRVIQTRMCVCFFPRQ